MKKIVTRVSAFVLSILILTLSVVPAAASETFYTYTYDYWGDVKDCPDFYSVSAVLTSSDLGLDISLRNANGLYAHGNNLYIMDSSNNRIVELERVGTDALKVTRIVDSFKGNASVKTFSNPTDMAIGEDGEWFICDQGNARILKLDADLNYLMEFTIPIDSTLDKDLVFQPKKLVIDTAGRVYACATGINKGLVKYEADGTFSGFVGATPVSFDFIDYVWKKIATQEQRAQMESFVPTEYDNVYMDSEGFIYAVTTDIEEEDLKSESIDAIRKLNLLGDDILVRNGEYPVYGDLYMGTGGGYSGPSKFADCTVFENDIYVCLDKNRGRLFGYNDQGEMVFAFGGNGNMDGYFKRPVAIEHMGYDLFVLDQLDGSITIFTTTEFGNLVYEAIDLFDAGDYTGSGEYWQQVMDLNGNYDLAYIGIGRSLLRQKEYKEAMEYFELKYDDENYSKAFKQYRKEWVEDHIVEIIIVIALLFLVPMTIGKVKSIKHELETADIFKV